MICSDVREYMFAFLDNELDAPLSIELQLHLDRCHDCAREVEIEHTILRELARSVEAGVTVPPLEAGILERGSSRRSTTSRYVRRSRRWLLAASVALVLTAGSAVYLAVRSAGVGGSPPFVRLVADDFKHFLDHGGRVQIASADAPAVAGWLYEKTGILATIPASDAASWRLIGGRKCKIDDRPAAFAAYEWAGVAASLVAVPANDTMLNGMDRADRLGKTLRISRHGDLRVVAIHRGDLVYAAVSSRSHEDLMDLVRSILHESD